MYRRLLLLISFFLPLTLPTGLAWADYEILTGNYYSHDPVMTRQSSTYYVFCTGRRTPIRTSMDMHNWQLAGYVWPSDSSNWPDWWVEEVPAFDDPPPGNNSNIWAPDISYFNGKYHLYYSISSFGSNDSCIGLATRTTLGAGGWTDEGPVICSEGTNYNAIDPALFIDTSGTPTTYWLAFGSFWTGIKMMQIDPNTGHPIRGQPLYSIAARPNPPNATAIEAPFIVFRNGFYYLFVSFDFCCRGVDSTYNVRYGRSTSVTGTYRDRNGVSMMSGGGTQLTWPDDSWKGPGHNAVFLDNDGRYWLIHHAYAVPSGTAYLRIHQLFWTPDGWPTLTEPNCADVHNLGYGLIPDWTQDCYVDFYDLQVLAEYWLNVFDLQDFADLGMYWLQCNNPPDANCTPNW